MKVLNHIQEIRVFLSSTFSDMQEERDALVKLFKQIADEGKKRGVIITLLDLRWGITNDQKRNGLVIDTCLQEIENSRPFFIGIVGDRYGWIPEESDIKANINTLAKYPILESYYKEKLSITEIEMRYGVLDTVNKTDAIFFLKIT